MPFKRIEHKYLVFLVCVTGIFVTVFDTSSAIVALPTIALEFGTDLPTAQWVILANGLTIAALLVPMGRLSDLIGRKRIYVVGACLFAVGAVLASLAGSILALIAARVFVGFGSAMTQGTAMAILVGNFEARERARMLGLQLGGVGLGSVAGPATGGFIVGTIGWRMLFAMTAVAMVLTAVVAQRVLKRRAERPRTDQPFDYAGALLFSSFLVALLLTLTLGPRFGWLEPATLAGTALVAVLLGTFLLVERRSAEPMVDLGLFRNGAFGLGALGAVVTFMCISSTRFLMPFFLQGVKGFAPSQIGLVIVPGALVTAVAAPFAGRLADSFGVRLVANIGIAFGTAIVTLTMGAQGYPPSLGEVGPAAGQGLLTAFTGGVRLACVALLALGGLVLAVLTTWSWRTRHRRAAVAPAAHGSSGDPAPPDRAQVL